MSKEDGRKCNDNGGSFLGGRRSLEEEESQGKETKRERGGEKYKDGWKTREDRYGNVGRDVRRLSRVSGISSCTAANQ